MHRIISYGLLFGILLLLDACKEVNPAGMASALWNGKDWQADNVMVSVNTSCAKGLLSLTFDRTRKGTHLVEELFINKVPLAVGQHPIQVINSSTDCTDGIIRSSIFTVLDGDQSEDTLPTMGLPGDYINITAYDAGTGHIEGNFAGVYMVRKGDKARTLSDTVRVTKGVFSARVQQ